LGEKLFAPLQVTRITGLPTAAANER